MQKIRYGLTLPQIRNQNFLVDRQIKEFSESHSLLDPFDESLLSGCAYDLRAGSILTSRNRHTSFTLSQNEYIVESGECITIETLEQVNLAERLLFAFIVNKHSILARGFFHPTTTIDPGFQGKLVLTFIHLGHIREKISIGQPIAKVIFMPIASKPNRIYGITQKPSYREGTLDVARIIENAQGIDDDSQLASMYGMPIKRLYTRLSELENSLGTLQLVRAEERRKKRRELLWAVIIALLSALLGAIVGEMYGEDIKQFINKSF